jgi:hypothetical protein
MFWGRFEQGLIIPVKKLIIFIHDRISVDPSVHEVISQSKVYFIFYFLRSSPERQRFASLVHRKKLL